MSEFKPLLESSPNAATRELLRAGLPDNPLPGASQRVAVALGLGTLAAATTSGAVAGGTTALAASGGAALGATGLSAAGAAQGGIVLIATKWLVGGLAAGSFLAGGAVFVEAQHAPQFEVASPAATLQQGAQVSAAKPVARALMTAQAELAPEPQSGVERGSGGRLAQVPANSREVHGRPIVNPLSTQESSRVGVASRTESVPHAEHTVTPLPSVAALPPEKGRLGREVALIDSARRAVAAGDPSRAMAELDQYDGVRETRILDREARLLRIDVHVQRGEHERAAELARQYLRHFPNDPHSARLKKLLERPFP